MATTVLRTASALRAPPSASLSAAANSSTSRHNFSCVVSFPGGSRRRRASLCLPVRSRVHRHCSGPAIRLPVSRSSAKFSLFASDGDAAETAQTEPQEQEQVQESELEENQDVAPGSDDILNEVETTTSEETASIVVMALKSYREALGNNDESKISDLEAFLTSIEDEKVNLERKLLMLTEELSLEKDRVLRISADFENFRKRTEREKLSLVTNAQGEVVEKLLPVLDNFDRAKTQIKVETEGEEKINNSYQSISKQFGEVLGSLGVIPVETIGKTFDPLLHEAIMREDSTEFDEGVIIQEFRKGFQLGDRLLRPSMVKVSAGPGPVKPETSGPTEEQGGVTETGEEGGSQQEEANETA